MSLANRRGRERKKRFLPKLQDKETELRGHVNVKPVTLHHISNNANKTPLIVQTFIQFVTKNLSRNRCLISFLRINCSESPSIFFVPQSWGFPLPVISASTIYFPALNSLCINLHYNNRYLFYICFYGNIMHDYHWCEFKLWFLVNSTL